METKREKIKEIKDFLERKPEKLRKIVSIIFDGKQYNIRIPIDFAKKAVINPETDEFEFTLDMSEDKTELPMLYGDLVEKEKTSHKR